MVFIGAFTSRVLLVFLMQNGGLFLLTFQREFGVGAALTGWLGSLPMATRGLIGKTPFCFCFQDVSMIIFCGGVRGFSVAG